MISKGTPNVRRYPIQIVHFVFLRESKVVIFRKKKKEEDIPSVYVLSSNITYETICRQTRTLKTIIEEFVKNIKQVR